MCVWTVFQIIPSSIIHAKRWRKKKQTKQKKLFFFNIRLCFYMYPTIWLGRWRVISCVSFLFVFFLRSASHDGRVKTASPNRLFIAAPRPSFFLLYLLDMPRNNKNSYISYSRWRLQFVCWCTYTHICIYIYISWRWQKGNAATRTWRSSAYIHI